MGAKRRRILWALGVASAVLAFATIRYAARRIERASAAAVFAETQAVPHERVGLVLGCSPVLRSGAPNGYFENRIAAAAALFRAGKVDYLLVSGDNHVATYDEPAAMRSALVQRGVPADRIVCDYAGFSTLDSIVRAQRVFGLREFCVITQREHALRALYVARAQGIAAVAFAADDVPVWSGWRTRARESLARVRTLLDVHVVHRQPHFLGPAIAIGR